MKPKESTLPPEFPQQKTTQPQRVIGQLTPQRILVLVGFAIVTMGVLIVWGGGVNALAAILAAEPKWVLLAFLIHYSGFMMRGLRWQMLLQAMGHRLTWRYATTILLSGWFVSALLPARAGDFVRIGILARATETQSSIPAADSIGSIVIERILDLCALLLLGASAGFLLLRTSLPQWLLWSYAITFIVLLTSMAVVLFMPSALNWLIQRWRQPWWQRVLHFVLAILQNLQGLGRKPMLLFLVLLESLYIWLCDALVMWMVLRALDIQIGIGITTFVALSVDIFAAVPFTPGGIGQVEAVNATLLALLALDTPQIAASVLINRFITYWSFLLFSGLVSFTAGIGQLLPKVPQLYATLSESLSLRQDKNSDSQHSRNLQESTTHKNNGEYGESN